MELFKNYLQKAEGFKVGDRVQAVSKGLFKDKQVEGTIIAIENDEMDKDYNTFLVAFEDSECGWCVSQGVRSHYYDMLVSATGLEKAYCWWLVASDLSLVKK